MARLMREYKVVTVAANWWKGKEIKYQIASNPLSACKKAFRLQSAHWHDEPEKWERISAKVYLNDKLVARCVIEDNG